MAIGTFSFTIKNPYMHKFCMTQSSIDIRRKFLQFFQDRGHCLEPSASLIPSNDPSLLFTAAGMIPFKGVFLGQEQAKCPAVTTCQKCVRAGGKHNDLEEVGRTKRHHTFFEMMGNFSFGDYFKEQAIVYAWDLLTRVFALDKERLWVTVYHTDDQAIALWKKIARLDDHRILRIATEDNFWSMGETGPCGPCSEIFYDHGPQLQGGLPGTPDQDGDRYVEIWNIVFMQYNQISLDHRQSLSALSIDTGMGLERMAAVLQGVDDNFDTDLFVPLIQQSCAQVGANRKSAVLSHRVIADHVRSSSFLIADGVMPANEGRGYVLRRILRRALRHVHLMGGGKDHLVNVSGVLVDQMRDVYPQLGQSQAMISAVLREEAVRFHDLLRKGLCLLDQWVSEGNGHGLFPGQKAFQLYDTYGFPLDLTQDILKERGVLVNEKEFQDCMNQQKERSRRAWSGSGDAAQDQVWSCFSGYSPTHFDGYQGMQGKGSVQAILVHDQKVDSIHQGQSGWVVLDRTPFYGESGGQMGDKGYIRGPRGTAQVMDTQKKDDIIVHHVQMTSDGDIAVGDILDLDVDTGHRKALSVHHSATHLLHAAMRHVLGEQVMQKGSKVSWDKLRFDFNHAKPLTDDQIAKIEDQVNRWIQDNGPVTDRVMAQKDALAEGAMAFFGDKYGDVVRVVTMGDTFSKELCGGTHVHRTGDIGLFKIVGQSSVASGVRRLEAMAGMSAVQYVQEICQCVGRIADKLKTSTLQVEQAVDHLCVKEKQKSKKGALPRVDLAQEKVGDVVLWHGYCAESTPKDLKRRMDDIFSDQRSGVVLLTCPSKNALSFVVGVSKDISAHYGADKVLKKMIKNHGCGGGHDDRAQGSRPDVMNHEQAVHHIKIALSRGV